MVNPIFCDHITLDIVADCYDETALDQLLSKASSEDLSQLEDKVDLLTGQDDSYRFDEEEVDKYPGTW